MQLPTLLTRTAVSKHLSGLLAYLTFKFQFTFLSWSCPVCDTLPWIFRVEGGIPPLVELLEFSDAKVQRAAAGALRTLAFKNDENKNQVSELVVRGETLLIGVLFEYLELYDLADSRLQCSSHADTDASIWECCYPLWGGRAFIVKQFWYALLFACVEIGCIIILNRIKWFLTFLLGWSDRKSGPFIPKHQERSTPCWSIAACYWLTEVP